MTTAPKEETYSEVVDHENVQITLFLAEHNDLKLMAADIGNAYLHAKTREKVYIIAGPEFGTELEGRVLLVVKSLYGLTTSAARWHEELSKTLRAMGFTPTKADHDLWLKDCGTHYEYLCTWVDDIIVASQNARTISEEFPTKAKYTLKGVGEPSYYLGGNFGRVPTTLIPGKKATCFLSARTYIDNVCEKIEEVFNARLQGRGLKSSHMPMSPEYRPEIDDSPLLSPEDGSRYRMLVGSALWATTLGRHDILLLPPPSLNITLSLERVISWECYVCLDNSSVIRKPNWYSIPVTLWNLMEKRSLIDGENCIQVLAKSTSTICQLLR